MDRELESENVKIAFQYIRHFTEVHRELMKDILIILDEIRDIKIALKDLEERFSAVEEKLL